MLTPVADPSGLAALILLTSPAAQLKLKWLQKLLAPRLPLYYISTPVHPCTLLVCRGLETIEVQLCAYSHYTYSALPPQNPAVLLRGLADEACMPVTAIMPRNSSPSALTKHKHQHGWAGQKLNLHR